MNFNKILQSLFGNKSTRDMKLIQPIVEKIKAEYPKMQALSNDELRAKTKELQKYVQEYAKEEKAKIAELKAKIEDTPIDEREGIFNQIDKLEQEALDKYEVALNEVLPQVFAIVKDTARRFAENEETIVTATDFDRELASNPANDFVTIDGDKAIYHNHWTAGGNDMKWEMIHYDVQLFGGVVLHQGKIAEMATGEGKTLVGTTPIFLNALTGNGVHVVTVNDYLAKRDSEWMGPLYMFHGLSVDCIDKHRPNSDERRKAYLADITFGTNNEFGFDYLRDNMATNPADLVQRQHNYAIVDEVDSVLIDDARTPLIISGPIPKGDDQMFEQYQPLVEKLYEVQRKQATELLAEAKQKINEGTKAKNQELLDEGFLALFRSYKALPKNKPLIKYLSEEGIKAGLLKTEEYYMANNNREMPKATEPLYFVVDEKMNSADLTDKGTDWLAKQVNDKELFVLPDITTEMSELEARTDLTDQERLDKKDEMLKVGLLDEDFFMYGEDIDLSYRILKGGYQNYYLPVDILHYKGESTQKSSFRYVHVFYEAMLIFFRKHYSGMSHLLSIPVKFAIYARASVAFTQMMTAKIRKSLGFFSPSHVDLSNQVLFDADEMSYEEMLHQLAQRSDENIKLATYTKVIGKVITDREVMDKDEFGYL